MRFPKTRAELAKLASNPRELAKAAPMLCRASRTVNVLGVRAADGSALTTEQRDELLAKAVAKEYVEIQLDIEAYSQKTGERNRNFVRFRDGMMMAFGRTGAAKPFLRNHDQGDVLARAGTIISSSTEKLEDGHYVIRQSVKLTAPWAVELALRGLLDFVSIGWNPTGNILCSACEAPIFSQCWHWPGDTLVEEKLASGKPGKLKRDPNGDIVVEWVFTEAELIETSVVNVPGVPTARIEDVRAALSAAFPSLRSDEDHEGVFPNERTEKMDKEFLALLGLAEDATDEQIKAAILALKAKGAELAIHQKVLDRLNALEADAKKRATDSFIAEALSTGRIGKADEESWRELHAHDSKRAVELMAKREPNSATPVGAPRQSAVDPAAGMAPVITGGEPVGRGGRSGTLRAQLSKALAAAANNPKAASFAHHWFGHSGKGLGTIPDRLSGGTAIANGGDLEAARVGFHVALLEQLGAEDDPVGQIVTEVPSTKKVEEYDWMGDLPDFTEWKTERDLAGLEGFSLRMSAKQWANGLRIKANDIKDDALGLLPTTIGELGSNARFHRFDVIAKKLVNGFDGVTEPEVGDGLAYDDAFFFSAAHRGGNDNLMTGAGYVAFGGAALAAMNLKLRRMKRYDGKRPYRSKLTHVFIGPKNEDTALKLATQDYLANGESNPYKGRFQFVVSDLLDGDYEDYYFGLDLSRGIRPMLLQMREDISTSAIIGGQGTQNDSYQRFMFNELLFGAEARYDVGYFEFRTIVGARP